MIPIGDDNSDRRSTPVLTWALIALNVLVFVVFQGCGANDRFTYALSTVPEEILTGKDLVTADQTVTDPSSGQRYTEPGLGVTPISVYLTLIVSMFMHGGFAHLAGNMLYLFVFGDNVEDRIGRVRFLLFYLFCGVVASLAQVFDVEVDGAGPRGAEPRGVGRHLGRARRVPAALPEAPGAGDRDLVHRRRAGLGGGRHLVRLPAHQRPRLSRRRHRRRGRLRGPRRRLRCGPRHDQAVGPARAAARGAPPRGTDAA